MDWVQIVVGIVSSVIIAGLGKWLNVKVDAEQRKKLDWAIELAVAAVAQRLWGLSGPKKQEAAIQVAESLAPKAMASLTDTQKAIVVDAVYARLKPSLPSASSFSIRGEDLDHATDTLGAKP